jgi:hypothetical protein
MDKRLGNSKSAGSGSAGRRLRVVEPEPAALGKSTEEVVGTRLPALGEDLRGLHGVTRIGGLGLGFFHQTVPKRIRRTLLDFPILCANRQNG